MNLWIRTQREDSLVKVDEIRVVGSLDRFENEVWLVVVKDTILARYKAEENAFKVLEDIQKILSPVLVFQNKIKPDDIYDDTDTIYSGCSGSVEQLNTYVYKMPPEVE